MMKYEVMNIGIVFEHVAMINLSFPLKHYWDMIRRVVNPRDNGEQAVHKVVALIQIDKLILNVHENMISNCCYSPKMLRHFLVLSYCP